MSQRNVIAQIDLILQHLEQFHPIINCHMVEYFTKSLYESNVPDDIKRETSEIGFKNATFGNTSSSPFLHEYVEKSKQFSLYNCPDVCMNVDLFKKQLISLGCREVSSLKLDVFMKPKKSHEVEILSAIVGSLCELDGTSHVVDVGDGKGYLSSMLALHHKVSVLGVDSSHVNTNGAVNRVQKLGKIWHSIEKTPKKSVLKAMDRRDYVTPLYKQVTRFVTDDVNLKLLVEDIFLMECSGVCLVGLHTCGDLSPVSLNIFVKDEHVKTICNVGCCYHLLSEQDKAGFPMSDYLNRKGVKLSRNARMLSAQSIDRLVLKTPNRIVFYRAVFEVLIEKLHLPDKNIGRIKKSKNFLEYARLALQKLDSDVVVSNEEINNLYESYLGREDEMLVYNFLRCASSPAIEALILLDRLLFLKEHGYESSYLVQLFDPIVSPRCYGIVAFKNCTVRK